MKTTELKQIITTINKLHKKRNTLPILDNILFTEGKAIYCNFEFILKIDCSYSGEDILLPIDYLKKLISTFPNKEIILNKENVEIDGTVYKYDNDNIEEYPSLWEIEGKPQKIEKTVFELLDFTEPNNTRYTNYIHIEDNNIVASNSHILGFRKINYDGIIDIEAKYLKAFDKKKDIEGFQIEVLETNKNRITTKNFKTLIKQGSISIQYIVPDYLYPKWKNVIPYNEPEATLTILNNINFDAVKKDKSAWCVIENELFFEFKLNPNNNNNDEDNFTIKENIIGTKTGELNKTIVNANLLETIVKSCNSDKLEIKFYGGLKPILVNDNIIMPLKIDK